MRAILLCLLLVPFVAAFTPVVIWHGMGDSCCNPLSMGRISKVITDTHNGTYVYSIMIGNNIIEDTAAGFFKNSNDQITEVCEKIKADPKLAGGFHALGFSQGGQFLRALVQRCGVPMRTLVSFGGQHQGVFGLPHCTTSISLCEKMRQLVKSGAYKPLVQDHVVQAEYWHDPLHEDLYRNASVFLADINQENRVNETYRENLLTLENLVLVKFNNDSMVIPRESEWFGYYTPGQDANITALEDSPIYTEDRLGLKQLDKAGKLIKLGVNGDHLQFSDEWFIENVLNKYLN